MENADILTSVRNKSVNAGCYDKYIKSKKGILVRVVMESGEGMIIGICDDDVKWCKRVESVLEEYAERWMLLIETIRFSSGDGLLAYQGLPIDVLFLDISLEGESGIDVAEEINRKWKSCQIVYLTSHLDYVTEVYRTEHIFFVLKEQFEKRIGEIFGKILHVTEKNRKQLLFNVVGGKVINLAPDEIYYFERMKRVTVIETVWGKHEIHERLNTVMEMLPQTDFVRCHNSYIVYLPAVREMLKDTFLMKNGEVITISRSYIKNVKAVFGRWMEIQG